jgi:hypothetical protein
MMYRPSGPDRFRLERRKGTIDANIGEPINLDVYQERSIRLSGSVGVILYYGQSNRANFATGFSGGPIEGVYMLDPFTGKFFLADEPMVGCNGAVKPGAYPAYANAAFNAARRLKLAGWRNNVVVVNVCAGGTNSNLWANPPEEGGLCSDRLRVGPRRILEHWSDATVIMRQQGEQDCVDNFSQEQVTNNIRKERAILRSEGMNAPILVARTARNTAAVVGTAQYNAVRAGQNAAIAEHADVYPGLDTDQFNDSYRADGTHWNQAGLDANGSGDAAAIMGVVP